MKTFRSFPRPALALCGLLACAPILVAGCGGGSTTSTPSLSANYTPGADLIYSSVSIPNNAYTARVQTLSRDGANNLKSVLVTAMDGTQNVELSGINRIVNVETERRFDVFLEAPSGQSFAVGQQYPLSFGTRNNILIRQSNPNGDRLWQSEGGVAVVTAVSSNSISLNLIDARFVPSPTFFAVGNFLLNGTIGATGLRTASG